MTEVQAQLVSGMQSFLSTAGVPDFSPSRFSARSEAAGVSRAIRAFCGQWAILLSPEDIEKPDLPDRVMVMRPGS